MDWTYRREKRASWEDIAQAIRDTVTMDEVLSVYCPHLPRRGHRCPCPLHNGKDFNFSFTDKGYKCFVCGASGDVVAFVKEVCELATRADAMKRLNCDLRLNLPIHGEISEQLSAELSKRMSEAEEKKKRIESWNIMYNSLMDEWIYLDKTIRESEDPVTVAGCKARIIVVEDALDSLPPEPKG